MNSTMAGTSPERLIGVSPEQATACLTSRRLQLILMPTEACNFRCVYCYETFALKRMAVGVVTGVKALLMRRAPGLHQLGLSWFGGEPTLALDIVEDVMEHARELESCHPELQVRSDITTNGFLLSDANVGRLLRLGVTDYQISFDGPREQHDRKRVRPGGAPTFDRIWENLVGMQRRRDPYRVTIRVHVDRENVDSIPGFLSTLARQFGGDQRFDLYIRPIARLGGPQDATLPVLPKEEGAAIVANFRRDAERLGLRLAGANTGEPICYAAYGNSFVVRADGRLNKCTVALDLPANQVGRIRDDGTLELQQHRALAWMRGLRTGDPRALACPLQGIGAAAADDDPARPAMIPLAPRTTRAAVGIS